jgi:hypothetical protein
MWNAWTAPPGARPSDYDPWACEAHCARCGELAQDCHCDEDDMSEQQPIAQPGVWQPIESAPFDGTIIDVWLGDADDDEVSFYCTPGTRRSCGWRWHQWKFRPVTGLGVPVVTVRPTHWMPLPEPPK